VTKAVHGLSHIKGAVEYSDTNKYTLDTQSSLKIQALIAMVNGSNSASKTADGLVKAVTGPLRDPDPRNGE
jgi:hypothetical protein